MSGPIDFERYEGHTPGPWTWAEGARCPWHQRCAQLGGLETDGHKVFPNDGSEPALTHVWEPDGALIADAPMLLARLRAVHELAERWQTELAGLIDRQPGAPFTHALHELYGDLMEALNGEVELTYDVVFIEEWEWEEE